MLAFEPRRPAEDDASFPIDFGSVECRDSIKKDRSNNPNSKKFWHSESFLCRCCSEPTETHEVRAVGTLSPMFDVRIPRTQTNLTRAAIMFHVEYEIGGTMTDRTLTHGPTMMCFCMMAVMLSNRKRERSDWQVQPVSPSRRNNEEYGQTDHQLIDSYTNPLIYPSVHRFLASLLDSLVCLQRPNCVTPHQFTAHRSQQTPQPPPPPQQSPCSTRRLSAPSSRLCR